MAVPVDGLVDVDRLASDRGVGLAHASGAPDAAAEGTYCGIPVERGELPHLDVACRRVNPYAQPGQQFGDIGVAQAIAQVPPHCGYCQVKSRWLGCRRIRACCKKGGSNRQAIAEVPVTARQMTKRSALGWR